MIDQVWRARAELSARGAELRRIGAVVELRVAGEVAAELGAVEAGRFSRRLLGTDDCRIVNAVALGKLLLALRG